MPSPQPRPEDKSFRECLTTGLEQGGYHIVSQTGADFMLSCAVEEDWQTYQHPATPAATPCMQSTTGPILVPPGSALYTGSRWAGETPASATYTEEHVAIQGIRLRLYWSQGLRTGRFDTAWEGYIEAGKRLNEAREPLLLKTLLRYFGRNYSGKVKLAE